MISFEWKARFISHEEQCWYSFTQYLVCWRFVRSRCSYSNTRLCLELSLSERNHHFLSLLEWNSWHWRRSKYWELQLPKLRRHYHYCYTSSWGLNAGTFNRSFASERFATNAVTSVCALPELDKGSFTQLHSFHQCILRLIWAILGSRETQRGNYIKTPERAVEPCWEACFRGNPNMRDWRRNLRSDSKACWCQRETWDIHTSDLEVRLSKYTEHHRHVKWNASISHKWATVRKPDDALIFWLISW